MATQPATRRFSKPPKSRSTKSRSRQRQSALVEKNKILVLLETLPADALPEVLRFVEFLQTKATPAPAKRPIRLGNIWAGVPLNGVEEDLRRMRRGSLEHLNRKFANGELPR